MLTDFYNIWHRVYKIISNTKAIDLPISPTVAALPCGNLVTCFGHFGRCFMQYGGNTQMSRFLVLRWGYRLGNGPLLQMLDVTTIGSHGSLPPPCWCVLVAALLRQSAKRLSIHQLFLVLAEFMVLFQHDGPDVMLQSVQIWRVWGYWFFLMNAG